VTVVAAVPVTTVAAEAAGGAHALVAARGLGDPLLDDRGPVGRVRVGVRDAEAAVRVVSGGQEAAALVELEHHLDALRVGDEGHLDLVDGARVLRGRVELDLLVERQRRSDAVDRAPLQVGALEAEAQPREGVEDPLLCGQRVHRHFVEVALVDGLGHGELGPQPHRHAAQPLAVDVGDRRLPRHREREGQVPLLALAQLEGAGDREPVELDETVAVLGLDPGHQTQHDSVDGDVVVTAGDPHLALQGQTGPRVRVGQHGVDGRPADAEGAHHLLENHRVIPP
jgi:hypothetical protein